MTDEEKIANAMTAGPTFITADAAVLDDPSSPVNDPRCDSANWLQIAGKPFGAEREASGANALGLSYMLQGGSVADNDDPSVDGPAAGEEWQIDPPHVMVNSAKEWDPAIYAHDHAADGPTGPWIMFSGTPAEYIMFPIELVPVESEAGDDKIANALSAGPTWLREGAGVIDWPAEAGGEVSEAPAQRQWLDVYSGQSWLAHKRSDVLG